MIPHASHIFTLCVVQTWLPHCLTPASYPVRRPSLNPRMLTSAFANASAALAAAGQGKKAAQVQLQAELNTNDEWNKFLSRDGLLVVDVYTEWCGPCIGMVGNLKKIKVELGGDNLHLAVAKSDTIDCLKRFRNRSEPTWMFIAAGQLLNVIFGADAPRIARTIEDELKNEDLAKKGERERPKRAPDELTPHEQIAADAQEKLFQERKAKEAAAAAEARLARREARAIRLETHFLDVCPGLMTPHAQKNIRKVADALEPYGVVIADKCPTLLTRETIKLLAAEDPAFGAEATAAAMIERPSLVLLLKKQPDREGEVIELSHRAIFGGEEEADESQPPKKTLAEELSLDTIPGIFIPADRHQRAAALDLLFPKMVSTVVEPPVPPEPPHVAMVFGAWQRRAVLGAASAPTIAPNVIRYGFFANASVEEPKLLCKTVEQYELRGEKDYCETIILQVAVGLAEPALADPGQAIAEGPPAQLLALGPLHVSADSVLGGNECAIMFPPGYSTPELKAKPKSKKKKKKRHTKESTEDQTETPSTEPDADGDTEPGEADPDADGDPDGDPDADEDDADEAGAVDKATSPPPLTPH